MDRNILNIYLATILETLDMPGAAGGVPRSHVMLGLGLDLNAYLMVERILVASDMVKSSNDLLTITDKGKEMAAKVAAALPKVSKDTVSDMWKKA